MNFCLNKFALFAAPYSMDTDSLDYGFDSCLALGQVQALGPGSLRILKEFAGYSYG